MKDTKLLLVSLLLFIAPFLFAQNEGLSNPEVSDSIYTLVDHIAEFPGGATRMYEYLSNKFHIPNDANKFGLTGRVFAQFVIEVDGSISNVEIINNKINPDFSWEQKSAVEKIHNRIINIVKKMPKWKPAEKNGKKVRLRLVLPFNLA